MKQGWKTILSVALIYCGTVFGAGFASGQEIVSFFSRHGIWGVIMASICGVLFAFCGGVVCSTCKTQKFLTSKAYFRFLFPKVISQAVHLISMAFLVVSFCIMITGCSSLLYQQFALKPVVGAVLSLGICYLILKYSVTGLAFFNALVTPIMFFGVIALCALVLFGGVSTSEMPTGTPFSSAVSGGLYVSYNLVSAVAVLVPASALVKTNRQGALGGALGGVLVAIPLTLMAYILAQFSGVQGAQMPFFQLISMLYPYLAPFCALILYCAMMTTAASAGVSVISHASSDKSSLYLCGLAFLASFIPFDVLVKTMYTIFGVCGLLLFFGIVLSFFRKC